MKISLVLSLCFFQQVLLADPLATTSSASTPSSIVAQQSPYHRARNIGCGGEVFRSSDSSFYKLETRPLNLAFFVRAALTRYNVTDDLEFQKRIETRIVQRGYRLFEVERLFQEHANKSARDLIVSGLKAEGLPLNLADNIIAAYERNPTTQARMMFGALLSNLGFKESKATAEMASMGVIAAELRAAQKEFSAASSDPDRRSFAARMIIMNALALKVGPTLRAELLDPIIDDLRNNRDNLSFATALFLERVISGTQWQVDADRNALRLASGSGRFYTMGVLKLALELGYSCYLNLRDFYGKTYVPLLDFETDSSYTSAARNWFEFSVSHMRDTDRQALNIP